MSEEESCSTSNNLETQLNDGVSLEEVSPNGLEKDVDVVEVKGDDDCAEEKDGRVKEKDGDVKEMDLQDKSVNGKSADVTDVPSWLESSKDESTDVPSWLDSACPQGEEPLLSDIVWKQRSGLGKYAIQHSWERRRLVLEPSRVLYYHLDDSKPHGILEMEQVTVETNMAASFEICLSTPERKWRVCFDTRAQREAWLSALQDIEKAVQDKQDKATHTFQPGDHVIRWEMLPIAYPIQIHGIVLETGKNCVILADFGLTTFEEDGSVKADDATPTKESKWKKLLSFHRGSSILEPTKEQEETEKDEEDEQQLEDIPGKEQEEPDKANVDEKKQEVVASRILAKIKKKDSPSKKQVGPDKLDAHEEQQEEDSSGHTEAKKQEGPDKSDTDEEQHEKDSSSHTEAKKQEGPDKSDAGEEQQGMDSSSHTQAKEQTSKADTSMDSKKQEADEKKLDDSSHMRNMMAAWGKPTKRKRLNVVVLTDPADIQKWHKVNYGRSFLDKGGGGFASWFHKPSKGDETVNESRSMDVSAVKDEDNNRTRADSVEENVGKSGGFVSWFLQQKPTKDDEIAKLNSEQSLSALSVKDEAGTETQVEPVEENLRKGGGFTSWLQKLEDEVVREPGSTEDSSVKEPSSADESAVKDEDYDQTESCAETVEEMDPDTLGDDSQVKFAAPDSSTTATAGRTNRSRAGTEEESIPSKQQPQKLPKSDPTPIVLARVNFLLEFGEDVLPPYHVFHSNSECIAVWCKTGRWSTLQTAVFLHSTAIGNAKSSMLLTASVAAAHVVLVPALAVGGLAMVTAPWLILKQSKKHWDESTRKLTDLFWSRAEPAVFVAAIEHWSNLQHSE